jgi:polynucleotide 5'-kinase involved in rRNA processing
MTKDDIIRMADASGLSFYGMGKDRDKFVHYLAAFAKLVAEAEREACAKVCEERGMVKGGEVFAARIRARGNT